MDELILMGFAVLLDAHSGVKSSLLGAWEVEAMLGLI